MKKLLIVLLLLTLIPSAQATTKKITPVDSLVSAPEPTPTPKPTPLPTYYPTFDYTAAKADPEAYTGQWYTLTGMVISAHEEAEDDEEMLEYGDYFVILTVALDGNWEKLALITYMRDEEDPCPEYQEMISCYGKYMELRQQNLSIGGYVMLPEFGTRYIVHL